MLLRSRHWKKLSRASQQRARCDLLGAIPSVEEDEDELEPNQPIVCFRDGLKDLWGGLFGRF